MLIAVLLI